MYRLIEENKLKRLIESDMIYNELCAQGVDNWIGCDFIHYPDEDEINNEVSKFLNAENLSIKDGDTIIVTVDTDISSIEEYLDNIKSISNMYPKNKFLLVCKGTEITREEK